MPGTVGRGERAALMNVVPAAAVPALTAAQMREVDRAMIEELYVELAQMMENAGRNLADLTLRRFAPGMVVVLAGGGGNGGGGLVAARHLANRGASVRVVLSRPHDLAPVPAHQLDILRRMDVDIGDEPGTADCVVDALIGYSLRGDPTGQVAELISWANGQAAPVLALDTPSGLDVTTGRPASPCVHAAATMTLALPKVGLVGAPQVGELYLADVSVPPRVYRRFDLEVPPLFREDTVVRLSIPSGKLS